MSWYARMRSSASSALRLLEAGDSNKRGGQGRDGASEIQNFSRIYRDGLWGRKLTQRFYSGPGSHDRVIVEPYVRAVRDYILSLGDPPDVVDLGCGDFNVGRQLRDVCRNYIACDVADDLIRHNSRALRKIRVDFRRVDIVEDPLPEGRVAFLRQVLQHLSNEQIARVLPKLKNFKFVILTEHLPIARDFPANLDHTHGAGIRVTKNSGVVLTAPPFNLRPTTERELCRIDKYGGSIVTTAYELA
jgi:hypothetical protein